MFPLVSSTVKKYIFKVMFQFFPFVSLVKKVTKVKHKDKAMKAINPNMKLIAFACDPSRRAFSQLKMKDRRSQFKTEKGVDVDECKACLKGSFENVSVPCLQVNLTAF